MKLKVNSISDRLSISVNIRKCFHGYVDDVNKFPPQESERA
ncbi:MAG: hypothetical protein N3E45_13615 [Oscillatoriaceae bacterium SKW80]|nr:hypothetical protein [Oscillatoriaceae bacterium SKYG93]MCX8121838.1 hypothetical protein [Oscillatoriaceae bacterium SKW80]MDW8454599.1 hypothetical protein [Oscillatoriaceae cyanobacterium SKYGB_i_bin93]